MSILRDFIDLKSDAQKEFKINRRGSVARESARGVLQFPVLVSSALSLEQVTTVSKALEREYVSFVTIMCSLDSVTDETSIKNYVQKLHQNFGDNGDLIVGMESTLFSPYSSDLMMNSNLLEQAEDDSLDLLSSYGFYDDDDDQSDEYLNNYDDLSEACKKKANAKLAEVKREGNKLYKSKSSKCVTVVNESTKNISQIFFVSNLNEDTLTIYQTNIVLESVKKDTRNLDINSIANESVRLLEAYKSDLNMDILNRKFDPKPLSFYGNTAFNQKYDNLGRIANEQNIVSAIAKPAAFTQSSSVEDSGADATVMRDTLKDNDVKKANELAPTLLHLKTYFKDEDNNLHAVDYMIGVKTVVHKIQSDSMIENTVKAVKKGKSFFNLMRLTTGELSFFKDFVFAVNSIKDDIKTKFKDNPWWNSLTRRKKYADMLSAINFPQQLVPNTTLVLTMDEAVKIKSEYNIDIMKTSTAKDIMDNLFLLGFVVVDPSTEVSHFLFDGRNGYEEYSFNSLEKENSNSAKDIKNIMQVLGRM
jgi:hypothetical protein